MVRKLKNPEGCVTCGITRAPRWGPYTDKYEPYKMIENPRRNLMCAKCKLNLDLNDVSCKRSTIPSAGNGLFAHRDIMWNEEITEYSGRIYATTEKLPRDQRYILQKNGMYIDGRVQFGKAKGRYINAPPPGKKANARFGHRRGKDADLGHTVVIRAISRPRGVAKSRTVAIKKGEEILISYGNGYWNRLKK
jgi:hypothetical protein